MITHPVLIAGAWRAASSPSGTFTAVDPSTGSPLADTYPVSSWTDLEDALEAARGAMDALGPSPDPEPIAAFLEGFAERIEARRDELVDTALLETGLPAEPRLRSSEFPRLTGQLRQAAAAARDRSWRRATIDTRANIRSILGPIGGPVAVFSPNNFPFAFNSVGGGDFAAAIGAGNPVLAKANPGHPGTTRILAEAAFDAVREAGLPPATVQMVYHFGAADGLRLAAHPAVGAVAFTGSRRAGLALKEVADRAGRPISLEMSAINPVFVLPGALAERGRDIAAEFAGSCALGAGQFCTKPGLVALPAGPRAEEFLEAVRTTLGSTPAGILLSERVLRGLEDASLALATAGAKLVAGGRRGEGPGFRFEPTLFRVDGDLFLRRPQAFQVEVFGTFSVAVLAKDDAQIPAIAEAVEGSLTASVYSARDGRDDPSYARLEPILLRKAGRLLNDKMPTGVAVSPAMNHGGPFPATGHPGFTAVGIPASFLRFAALHSYDNVRPHRLPRELRDENPTGRMWRFVDGEWTHINIQI